MSDFDALARTTADTVKPEIFNNLFMSIAGVLRQAQPPLFYVAARGHHAGIGGLPPGSMPPHSRHIKEQGTLIAPFRETPGGGAYGAG